uniref:Putative monocarboxylate transporter n=1 Tax=Schistosoma mansoni TaxID=6183 RepID=A0A5K4ERH4_SCHMA
MIDFIDSKLLNKKSNCGIINKKKKTYQSKTDSGWGWIIVISSFIIQLIIDGTFGGFGVLYLSLRNDQAFVNKNYSQTILSMPGTIQPGFFLCTGSAFGILMVCAIVSVNYYFDRYRGLASGLAMSGAGVGTLLVPVFYNWIIPIKGWRSSLLLYSLGASLLTALASLTLKPFITNDSSDDPELTKQSTVIEDSKQTTSDQMLVMKTIPEITYIDDDVIYLPGKNHNRTVDITAIHSDCKPDDSVFDFNGEKKERKLSIGFTDALRQYLLNQKGPTDLSETDNDAEDAESMIGSRLWKSSLGFKRQPSSYIHNQSQLCQPAQSNQQQKQNYNKFPNQTTQATVAATHGYIHSSYNLSSTRNSRRRKFPSQIYTLFDKPDAFYSASLTNLNPKITQPFNGYKKSTDSLRAYSKYPIKSKSSLISSETVNKNQINELIDSNISSSLNQQHQEQNHKEFHSLDNSIHKSSNNDIYLKSSIIETSIPEENLLTTNNTENSTEFYTLTSKMNTITQNLGLFGYGIIKLFDLGLFTEPSFLYLVGIGITSQLAYFIPFVYLIDYTVSYGMEQDSAVLVVMILSIFHTLGRITSGIMSNVFHLDSVYLSGLATFGGGLAHVFLVFIIPHTFAWYSIYASIYGLCSGIPIPLIPILLVRFSGLEHLTASFSNLNLLKGIFSMIGPTVAITIVEYTSQKDHLFLVAGVCYIVSALLHLGLCRYSCFAKYSKSSTNKQRTNDYDDTSNFEDPYAKCFPCSFQ